MPQLYLFEGAQPIVDARVHVNHIGKRLDQFNRGQKSRPLQTVFVEVSWFNIRCGHQCHTPPKERRHKPSQNHSIGYVTDKKLVKTNNSSLRCNTSRHLLQGIFLSSKGGQLLMNTLHKPMEVNPELGFEGQTLIKDINQISLSPPNTTPEIQPLLWCTFFTKGST